MKIYNHDIRSSGPGWLGLSRLYCSRVLCLTRPDDVIQLPADLKSQWPWISAHYRRAGIASTARVIWDLRSERAADYPGHALSVFYFGAPEHRCRPDETRLLATRRMNSKNAFIEFARSEGVPVPETRCFERVAEARSHIDEIDLPVYVKPAVSLSGIGVTRCGDRRALASALAALEADIPVQLQHEIPHARFLNVQYRVEDGHAFPLPVSEQVLDGNAHNGNRVPCAWRTPGAVDALAEKAARLGVKEVFGFDVAVVGEDEYYVIECNPRFNSSTYPLMLAERLGATHWSTATLRTALRDLRLLDLSGIEYDRARREGVVIINWGAILHGKLMVMMIGDEARQEAFQTELKARLAAAATSPGKPPLLLSTREMARVTGGEWRHLRSSGVRIAGVNFFQPIIEYGDLFVWLNRKGIPVSEAQVVLDTAIKRGAVAAVVPRGSVTDGSLPVLEVAEPLKALQDLATATSLKFDGIRVLVTGSHGKTGFKTQLHHLIRKQMPTHAHLDSYNLEAPVWRTLAAIPQGARVGIFETAVPARNIGEDRALFVRPDYCVITGIGPEHLSSHKTLDNLIRNKADVVTGLRPGGKCLLNADDPYFGAVRDAVRARSNCPILTFGSGEGCDGRLLEARFEDFHWRVRAAILGEEIEYVLPLAEDYAPLASVSVLLMAKLLGAELPDCVAEYADYKQYSSSGNLYRVNLGQGAFHLYDQTRRGELKGFESMFELMSRMPRRGRRIAVVSEFINHEDNPGVEVDVPRMKALMAGAGIDLLYTVREFRRYEAAVPEGVTWRLHGEDAEDIRADLLATVREDDMVFIRGVEKAKLTRLVEALLAKGTGQPPYTVIY